MRHHSHSLPFSSDACLELGEQELVVEAVDGGDVGEDPCNDILRDSSLCELSAKYLQRLKKNKKTLNIAFVYEELCNCFQKHPRIRLWLEEEECKHRWKNVHVFVYAHWQICFLQIWLLECDKSQRWKMKPAHHSCLEPKVTSSNSLLCLTDSPEPKDSPPTNIWNS